MTFLCFSSSLLLSVLLFLLSALGAGGIIVKVGAAADELLPEEADFVIVGGGTAGCVLASRLCTALPTASIVLLERGDTTPTPTQDFWIQSLRTAWDVFLAAPEAIEADYLDVLTTQPNSKLVNPVTGEPGRTVSLLDAKTFGGASTVGFLWSRPPRGVVESWKIHGLDTDVAAEFFHRAEQKTKVAVAPPQLQHDYTVDAIRAVAQLNFTMRDKDQLLIATEEGSFTVQPAVVTGDELGHRQHAFASYLKPIIDSMSCHGSLTIVEGATATKLIPSNDNDKKIAAVQFQIKNSTTQSSIRVNREVILSAGPFGSPKLLQLSGIGPQQVLQDLGRLDPVLADLPVGQETQNRPTSLVYGTYSANKPLDAVANRTLLTTSAKDDFLNKRSGGRPYGKAIICSQAAMGDIGYVEQSFANSIFQNGSDDDQRIFTSLCGISPKGVGNITISSLDDPFAPPVIHLNLLEHPQDYADMLACSRTIRRSLEHFDPSFEMKESDVMKQVDLATWVATTGAASFNFASACAVGKVVNGTTAKVLGGMENIRVVDVSIIPHLKMPVGALASVYMLAEFFADKIVNDYKDDYDYAAAPSEKPSVTSAAWRLRPFLLGSGAWLY